MNETKIGIIKFTLLNIGTTLRGSEKPYSSNVKIVLMQCTFSQKLFIVGD